MIASWMALGIALTGTAFGQLFFKLYFDRRRMVFLAVALSLFLGTQLLAYVALRELDISLVYMSTAITQVMMLGLAHSVLKENITYDHIIAASLIVTGVVLFAL